MSDATDRPQDDITQDSQVNQKKKTKNRYLIAFLGVLIIFLAIPYLYTSNPKSCTRCHDMQKYYDSWKESSHSVAANNCFHCHVKPGTINLWVYRISFYREIYASMVGAKLKPAGASVPGVQSCQRSDCHSLNREYSGSGDIKINHRHHVTKADVPCTKCHPGVAHPNVGKIGKLTPPRKLCKTCHASRMDDCSFCHTKRNQRIEGFKHE